MTRVRLGSASTSSRESYLRATFFTASSDVRAPLEGEGERDHDSVLRRETERQMSCIGLIKEKEMNIETIG